LLLFFAFRLLKAAASALVPGSIEFIETVQEIRLDHLDACEKHISDAVILKRVQDEINQDCDRLKAFLEAAQVTHLQLYPFFAILLAYVSVKRKLVGYVLTIVNHCVAFASLLDNHKRSLRRFRQDPRISLWQWVKSSPVELLPLYWRTVAWRRSL
jgi:hypothetical protein